MILIQIYSNNQYISIVESPIIPYCDEEVIKILLLCVHKAGISDAELGGDVRPLVTQTCLPLSQPQSPDHRR